MPAAPCETSAVSTASAHRPNYQWKSKYGGLEASDLKRIKELEAENTQLKQIYADASIERDALKKLLAKKLKGR